MDTYSAHQVGTIVGSTTPRVLRAASRLGLDGDDRPGRHKRRFSAADLQALRSELAPPVSVPGLSLTQARVLAALARAPLGLSSVRAVARASGVSPGGAAAALRRLRALRLVYVSEQVLAEGRARRAQLHFADVTHPHWAALAPALAQLPEPRRTDSTGGSAHRVPRWLGHVFWNEDLGQLAVDRHGPLIARRVLSSADPQALAWAARALPAKDWEHALASRGTGPRDAALARALAAGARARADSRATSASAPPTGT